MIYLSRGGGKAAWQRVAQGGEHLPIHRVQAGQARAREGNALLWSSAVKGEKPKFNIKDNFSYTYVFWLWFFWIFSKGDSNPYLNSQKWSVNVNSFQAQIYYNRPIASSSYSLYFKQKRTNQLNMTSYVNVHQVRAQGELRYHLIEVPW